MLPLALADRLRTLGEESGQGEALVQAAVSLVDPAEPFELGLALSVGPEGSGLLLSYNPRIPSAGARARMLRALLAQGLPPEPARAAMAWVPADRCSTVLGLEWTWAGAGGPDPARATLYLEELARFWDAAGITRTTDRLARIAGLPSLDWGQDPGAPYIWALDLEAGGVSAMKTYRWTRDRAAVEAAVRAERGGELPGLGPWGGEVPASGYILQRRHRAGVHAPLKLYKTYAYEAGGGAEAAAAECAALLAPLDPLGRYPLLLARLPGAPLTSVGLRLGPAGALAGTAYWCLLRGPLPA